MADETGRAVYLQQIDPERREEYLAAHEDVPEGVTRAMAEAGVERFELYVRDEIAVCILEAEDVERYDEAMADDPAVEEWERHVAQFKTDGVDVDADDGGVPYMEEIWSFEP